MSTELSNTDKLREFVEELKRLKIEIIRPNINLCFADFKSEKNKIFYALSGIKSVGREAVSNLVKEREKNGKFKSINDFIKRVNPKDINKLQLEGLTKAGAFDDLESNRSTLLNSIPNIIQLNKSLWDEKQSKQNNLFEDNSSDNDLLLNTNKPKIWTNNEKLMNEFQSIGFYMSDHPLNAYRDYFEKMNVVSFDKFVDGKESSALVAGTIMSIQEKKSSKGTPFAIVKFSDLKSEFELFLFSDLLVSNRENLKTANSFILTLQKDNAGADSFSRRINIRKLVSLNDFTNKKYDKVTIEIKNQSKLDELQKLLREDGETKIQIKIKETSKIYTFELKNLRKFNAGTFNHIKDKEYIEKISF